MSAKMVIKNRVLCRQYGHADEWGNTLYDYIYTEWVCNQEVAHTRKYMKTGKKNM